MNQNDDVREGVSSAWSAGFYPIIIRKNDSFCVYLPEWKLSGEGATLDEAYQQFEANKRAVELRGEKYGLAFLTPEAYPTMKKKSFYQELALSFLKSSISVFAIVLIVVLLLPNLGAVFGHQIKNIIPADVRNPKFWAIEFPAKVNARLDALAPEDEERIRREWGRLLDRALLAWKPVVSTDHEEKPSHP